MPDTFFTSSPRRDGSEWFSPTDHARGPWDPDACHGGPPTALLVRALERNAWNVTQTARYLGVPLSTLKFKIERLEIRDLARKIKK